MKIISITFIDVGITFFYLIPVYLFECLLICEYQDNVIYTFINTLLNNIMWHWFSCWPDIPGRSLNYTVWQNL